MRDACAGTSTGTACARCGLPAGAHDDGMTGRTCVMPLRDEAAGSRCATGRRAPAQCSAYPREAVSVQRSEKVCVTRNRINRDEFPHMTRDGETFGRAVETNGAGHGGRLRASSRNRPSAPTLHPPGDTMDPLDRPTRAATR